MHTGRLALAFLGVAVTGGSASSETLHATVTLEVSGDDTYTIPHTIVIATTAGLVSSRDELERREWVAERTSERSEDRVTSSDCPALGAAVLAFKDLPPLSPSSVEAFRIAGEASLLPPVMLDGFTARISWSAVDGTRVQTVGGYWHRRWAHETISALIGCWGPLIPEGSSMSARPETPSDQPPMGSAAGR